MPLILKQKHFVGSIGTGGPSPCGLPVLKLVAPAQGGLFCPMAADCGRGKPCFYPHLGHVH